MQRDQLTRNSQHALQTARQIALDRGHAEIDAEHLFLALLEQPDGLVPNLLEKLAIKPSADSSATGTDPERAAAGQRPRS